MTRRRTIFAARPVNAEGGTEALSYPLPGHWKQRVKLARDMGANVSRDADARAFLKERGYGDIR